ncbi:cobalt transporter ATP-binding subunit [Mycoplasmopsis arginini]|nr:cobalt transporter ATP-binding subunit [Chlamydia trachomatis]SGA02813.1 cobalt transporter ATP-binding subunit [Chlamydia abortus]SGA04378.1 cobalt transporter ATP-binding subunit [Mycoplasmopsis arginini]CRH47114.1 cobalt transporter ATP-binding subunit [Chlamydia trachomatis]CRH55670.1 cobalt transporter ATP-binding subunit [Chlamydia trachomatis]
MFVKEGQIIKDGDTYEILSDNKLLIENNLIPTKLLSFVEKLNQSGFNIGKVTNIEQLAEKINENLKNKKKKGV